MFLFYLFILLLAGGQKLPRARSDSQNDLETEMNRLSSAVRAQTGLK